MINKNLTTETQLLKKGISQIQDELRLLVPVDFSPNSYQALQYAMHLAKMCNGTLDLFHPLDIKETVTSENPLSFNYELSKSKYEAYNRLNSLREIVTEFGAQVSDCYVSTGDPVSSSKKRFSNTSSHLLILGQANLLHHWEDSQIPILFIPPMILTKMPTKVLMIRDGQPIHERALHPLLRILGNRTNHLTVLDCDNGLRNSRFQYQLTIGNNHVDIAHKYELVHATERELTQAVVKFEPDMICRFRKNRTWWQKFWNKSNSDKVEFKIPTLILPY